MPGETLSLQEGVHGCWDRQHPSPSAHPHTATLHAQPPPLLRTRMCLTAAPRPYNPASSHGLRSLLSPRVFSPGATLPHGAPLPLRCGKRGRLRAAERSCSSLQPFPRRWAAFVALGSPVLSSAMEMLLFPSASTSPRLMAVRFTYLWKHIQLPARNALG